jgi:hypothetical protein
MHRLTVLSTLPGKARTQYMPPNPCPSPVLRCGQVITNAHPTRMLVSPMEELHGYVARIVLVEFFFCLVLFCVAYEMRTPVIALLLIAPVFVFEILTDDPGPSSYHNPLWQYWCYAILLLGACIILSGRGLQEAIASFIPFIVLIFIVITLCIVGAIDSGLLRNRARCLWSYIFIWLPWIFLSISGQPAPLIYTFDMVRIYCAVLYTAAFLVPLNHLLQVKNNNNIAIALLESASIFMSAFALSIFAEHGEAHLECSIFFVLASLLISCALSLARCRMKLRLGVQVISALLCLFIITMILIPNYLRTRASGSVIRYRSATGNLNPHRVDMKDLACRKKMPSGNEERWSHSEVRLVESLYATPEQSLDPARTTARGQNCRTMPGHYTDYSQAIYYNDKTAPGFPQYDESSGYFIIDERK